MKKLILSVFALTVLTLPCGAFAQQDKMTVTTTESAGTVTSFSPDTIMIRSETSTTPMKYTYSKKTIYVDERGTPVSVEEVKSGLPVTVYYTTEGSNMVAEKVVVRKTMTTTESPMIEKKTTTTTTK